VAGTEKALLPEPESTFSSTCFGAAVHAASPIGICKFWLRRLINDHKRQLLAGQPPLDWWLPMAKPADGQSGLPGHC